MSLSSCTNIVINTGETFSSSFAHNYEVQASELQANMKKCFHYTACIVINKDRHKDIFYLKNYRIHNSLF